MTEAVQFMGLLNGPKTRPPFRSHLNRGAVRRAGIVAVILGSALTLANQPEALFGAADLRLLPLVLVYLTPFVMVTVSQMLGARQAAADLGRLAARGTIPETLLQTIFAHGIPLRAALLGLTAGSVNAAMVTTAAALAHGGLAPLPTALLAQAFSLPALFGALSQALAYRRTSATIRREGIVTLTCPGRLELRVRPKSRSRGRLGPGSKGLGS